jgi:hypothetical protein
MLIFGFLPIFNTLDYRFYRLKVNRRLIIRRHLSPEYMWPTRARAGAGGREAVQNLVLMMGTVFETVPTWQDRVNRRALRFEAGRPPMATEPAAVW